MTVTDKLKAYCERNNLTGQDFAYMSALIKEAMKEQRHGCAEALLAVESKYHTFGDEPCVRKNVAYQAVFNAKPANAEK
jgi:hypothetical protein